MHWIESDLFACQGKAITNFDRPLPSPQSDLAGDLLNARSTQDERCAHIFALLSDYFEDSNISKVFWALHDPLLGMQLLILKTS